ncbi:neurofilament medium polypeptide-like [Salvia divinorum]|uniref:Neurofilament medium polypeptide-like n=1 Tax=Salvia divinorum TaxID=28513 RepID=A0ABD1HHI0_SALDI
MDWSESNLCIKCEKGGSVLLCNENGCPLAVHEGCLGGPARLDDAGRFYCPYCVYKQAVAETRKAREFLLARRKALLIFMDGSEKNMGENKTCEDNGRNRSNVNNGLCEDGKSKSNNEGVIDQPREEEKVEEDSESSGGSEGDYPSLKMNEGNGDVTVGEKQIREEEREASVEKENVQEEKREASVEEENVREEEREASVEDENVEEEEREASVEEENIQEKDFGTSSLTGRARAKRGSKRFKLVDEESVAVSVLQSKFSKERDKKKQASPTSTPARKPDRRSSSAMGAGKVAMQKFSSPRRLSKSEKQSKKSDTSGSMKRTRLMWTEEEEEALREGAKQYPVGAKIPWKKILEKSKKFDPTRTPADLKDKWRIQKFV